MAFNLDDYEPVAARLTRWLEQQHSAQPRVITHLVHYTDNRCVFRAELYEGDVLIATGWAEETRGEGMVNRTSHLENCESSAVGRSLANAGLSGSDHTKRPSREEMTKVIRNTQGQPVTYPDGGPVPDPFTGEQQTTNVVPMKAGPGKASDKQQGMIRALARGKGYTPGSQTSREASAIIGRTILKLDELTKQEASTLITAWKDSPPPAKDEEPF